MMMVLVLLLSLLVPSWAHAATYYLSASGSNANNGTSTSTPWLTWAHAFSNSACGDTLTVMNGTYTTATHGNPSLTKVCTASTVYRVVAQNDRQPLLSGTGANIVLGISNSAYIDVTGLRVKETDLNSGTNHGIVTVSFSNHVNLRSLIVYEPNRYQNTHAIHFQFSKQSLVEDTEIYSAHRHGILVENYGATGSSGQNVFRRVYCNGRGRTDIAGGYATGGIGTDLCIALYPSSDNIVENVIAEQGLTIVSTEPLSGPANNNQILGSIALGTRTFGTNMYYGVSMRARGTTAANQSQHNIVKHLVAIDLGDANLGGGVGIDCKSALDCQISNTTIINPRVAGFGAGKDGSPSFSGGGVYSFFCTNCLAKDSDSLGFSVTADIQTWTINYSHAYNNVTNYNPTNTHANITNEFTPLNTDPVLGTCKVWIPDGSPMKGAGLNGADIGANVLYRYVDGILTTTPLWDPTTGEFPHGAVIAGVNDTASTSLYNVHTRLNVNTGGCAFPSGYAEGTPPDDPDPPSRTAEGTTSTSQTITIPVGSDAVTVGVALLDSGGTVGSVSSVTVCGDALTRLAAGTSTPGYRRAELWGRLAPDTGECTVSVSTTGNVSFMVTDAVARDDVSDFGEVAGAGGFSATPTLTVPTNTSEVIIDVLAAKKNTTLTAGANQTLDIDEGHDSTDLRLGTSYQAGDDGGVMEEVTGVSSYWGYAVAALIPATPDPPPSTATLELSHFRWHGLYGTEASPITKAATDANVSIVPTGKIRLRMEVTANSANHPQVGLVLFCNRNGGAYAQAMDTFGSNVFRLYGAGAASDLPSSLTATTQQLNSGNFVAGALLRTTSTPFLVTLNNGNHTELEWALELNATAGDTVACRVYKDNGAAIDTYTVTPTLTVIPMMAGGGM